MCYDGVHVVLRRTTAPMWDYMPLFWWQSPGYEVGLGPSSASFGAVTTEVWGCHKGGFGVVRSKVTFNYQNYLLCSLLISSI